MPIADQSFWDKQVEVNDDPYGKAVVDVARRVMEKLDAAQEFDCHTLICEADKDVKAGGITGFMAGCVAQIVGKCHSRGDEFRRKWNSDFGVTEEKAQGGTVNPAILSFDGGK